MARIFALLFFVLPFVLPCVLPLVARPALAAKDERAVLAKRHYETGMAHYQLEEWDQAVAEWETGFRTKPAPQFLYNIAQAYRLSKRPDKALNFYQKYLRMGRNQISAAADTADTIELRTINRNFLTTIDYTFSKNWSVSVAAPVVSRSHSHIADPSGAATFEAWNFTQVGDMRALAYYRFNDEDK